MKVVAVEGVPCQPVTRYRSQAAGSALIASGAGAARVHVLQVEPGGRIGEHEAGYGQLLVVLSGSGWAAGADGARHPLAEGQAAWFERGELHSKGSDTGMSALIIQVSDLEVAGGDGLTRR